MTVPFSRYRRLPFFAVTLMVVLSLASCASVDNQYAFWRSQPSETTEQAPAFLDTQDIKAQQEGAKAPAPTATAEPTNADIKETEDTVIQQMMAMRDRVLTHYGQVHHMHTNQRDDLAGVWQEDAASAIQRLTSDFEGAAHIPAELPQYSYQDNAFPRRLPTEIVAPTDLPHNVSLYMDVLSAAPTPYQRARTQPQQQSRYQYGASNVQHQIRYGTGDHVTYDADGYSYEDTSVIATTPFEIYSASAPLPPTNAAWSKELAIFFDHGSSRLDTQDRQSLRQLADTLKQTEGRIYIVGYASARSQASSEQQNRLLNLRMSLKRAWEVGERLISFGLSSDRIDMTSHGDSFARSAQQATTMSATERDLAEKADRRVEVYVEQ